MQYHAISTDDIDELFSWGSGWDDRLLQLSPGPLGFRSRVATLPGVLIQWNSYSQTVLFHEVLREQALVFAMLVDGSSAVNYRGHEVSSNEGVILHPEQEQEYVVQPGCKSLLVIVERSFAQALGWELSSQRRHRLGQSSVDTLLQTCRDVTAMAKRRGAATAPAETDEAIRDRVLVALRDVLAPWLTDEGDANCTAGELSQAFDVVKHAEHLMAQWDSGRKLDVTEVAYQLELSQRSLYDAFRRTLGMGPYEFYLLRKMHLFRETLLDGRPFHGKIKQTAQSTGFQHLGRLTQSYRRHFGESPRDTLKRRDPS